MRPSESSAGVEQSIKCIDTLTNIVYQFDHKITHSNSFIFRSISLFMISVARAMKIINKEIEQ